MQDGLGYDILAVSPPGGGGVIVGRDAERRTIAASLDDPHRFPAVVVLEGEAGIGKTTLWQEAIRRATEQGYRVLQGSPTEAESMMPFSILGDLFDSVDIDELDPLPDPQRRALGVALLWQQGDPVDWRALSVSVLGSLRILAADRPILFAIDDVQWIDASSARVIAYALRRLTKERLAILLARRTAPDVDILPELGQALSRIGARTLKLDPLTPEQIGAIVVDRIEGPLRRTQVLEIHRQSGGNPFFAVELALAAERGEEPPSGLALAVPATLREGLIRRRFAELSPDALEMLLVASAAARPTPSLLRAAISDSVAGALDQAVAAGVVRVEAGEIRFAHPLYRSAIYADAFRGRRQRIHARLAAIVEDVEERGRHLGLSTDVPDQDVANEIEDAAASARTRGATDAAAELLDHAIRLSPQQDTQGLSRRLLDAAGDRFTAGNLEDGLSQARRAVDLVEDGAFRTQALHRLGAMEFWAGLMVDSRNHLEMALAQPDADDTQRCAIHSNLLWTMVNLGDVAAALDHGSKALELARRVTDEAVMASGYVAGAVYLMATAGLAAVKELAGERPALWEPLDSPVMDWPRVALAWALLREGDIDSARALFEEGHAVAVARGDEISREEMARQLARVTRFDGRWQLGMAFAREAYDIAAKAANPANELADLAWFEAVLGLTKEAEEHGGQALELAGDWLVSAVINACEALGGLELSRGRPGDAEKYLRRAYESYRRAGYPDPDLQTFPLDEVEALVALGKIDEAEALVVWAEAKMRDRPKHPGMPALGWGLVHAGRGELGEAEHSLESALQHHEGMPMPYELARTLLVLGRVRRRAGHKREARQALERALTIFEELGAVLWAERTREEMGRIGGRRPSGHELTEAELRVARLAAAGRSNREIADTLFMSPRTVEGHLSSAYRKLGVRSRTELSVFLDKEDAKRS